MDAMKPSSRRAPDWDAGAYDRISTPQQDWATRVLTRLALDGGETLVDLGCGTGRVTEALAARVPRGRVIAVDVSPAMIAVARDRLRDVPRIALVRADLAALPFDGVADLAFSTATFHWVLDQPRLFREIFRALKPGGRLEAQCGGGPNVLRLRRRAEALMRSPRFVARFREWREPWIFHHPATAKMLLEAAGFEHVTAGLVEEPTHFDEVRSYREFLARVVIVHYLSHLPEDREREAFLDALTAAAERDDPPLTLDYVRLNLSARRPMTPA
jgi:trans-aconitate 2-methyltransferase